MQQVDDTTWPQVERSDNDSTEEGAEPVQQEVQQQEINHSERNH